MNILIIGSGGREHTFAWKIASSPKVKEIFCAPGNTGTAGIATNIPIEADDIEGLLKFAREKKIDLTVVGPEVPLVLGITDLFNRNNLSVFGPDSRGARLEGSKLFCKEFLVKYNIPTASYSQFDEAGQALAYINKGTFPIVIKADGLAAGKGVTVALDYNQAHEAIEQIMIHKIFGQAGAKVVIEEFMQGEEASILAFCDGRNIVAMTSAQDHKRIFDGDEGSNTGGMGAYSPAPVITPALDKIIYETILKPTIDGLIAENIDYRGVLYAGLMITNEGPKVVEYNVRFGDPETQVILPRMKNDLVDVLMACVNGNLDEIKLDWRDDVAVTVVMAAKGYPGAYARGDEITGLDRLAGIKDTFAFHAGTASDGGRLLTAGGRVLAVTSLAPTLQTAIKKVYEDIQSVAFAGSFYRKDIGAKGLLRR